MPTKAIHGITVAHFYETYREKLQLELVTGSPGLHRLIREGSINRPSLALTGFFKYFANKRIQVFGAAEMTYLKTLPQRQQIVTFQEMVKRGIPMIVLTRNFVATHPMIAVSEEMKLPIFRTPMITMNFVNLATLCVDNEFAPSATEHEAGSSFKDCETCPDMVSVPAGHFESTSWPTETENPADESRLRALEIESHSTSGMRR